MSKPNEHPLQFLRFADLRERKIVENYPQLRLMIDRYGFPEGVLLSPNRRGWRISEIEQWLSQRPTQSSAYKPQPGQRFGRKPPEPNKAA